MIKLCRAFALDIANIIAKLYDELFCFVGDLKILLKNEETSELPQSLTKSLEEYISNSKHFEKNEKEK